MTQHFLIYMVLIKNYTLDKFDKKKYSVLGKKPQKEYFSDKEVQFINNNKNKNIYYLIVDGMTSLEEYKNLGGKTNTQDWLKRFEKFGYTYVSNSYSTFNDTATTLGSILNLDPITTEKSNISDDLYTELTFPVALHKNKFDLDVYPKLIKNLKKINYNFVWFGNYKHNCNYNKYLCIDYKKKSSKINLFNLNINFYVLKAFLINTPIEELYRIYYEKFFVEKTNINEAKRILKDNITARFISKVKKFQKKDSLYFYFIHDLTLKEPIYSYNSNCESTGFRKKINYSKDLNISKYLARYECMIKKIDEFILFLDDHDPNAIVIIQSDHGFMDIYKNIKSLERYAIINLIKVSKKCTNMISKKIDNVNGVRLALSCATQTTPKLIKKQIHYTDQRKTKNSKVIEIDIN